MDESFPIVVTLAGPSCSGKSTLTLKLAEALGHKQATRIELDRYYLDLRTMPVSERALQNFDHPDALEWPLLRQQISALAAGSTVAAPQYDFASHTRLPHTTQLVPATYVLIEGLYALYDQTLRNLSHLKIYVDAPSHLCLERRLTRDFETRGRTADSITEQYENFVRPMAEQYVLPTRRWADIVLDGHRDPLGLVACVLRRLASRNHGSTRPA